MASYRYATKELSINNAKAFIQAASMTAGTSSDEDTSSQKKSTILYAVIGRTEDWANEPNPSEPADNDQYLRFQIHREAYGAKKITGEDMSHVAPRYDWTSGTVYSMYRDTDVDMYEKEWYVLTDDYNVYICLFNNKGGQSTIKPTGFSTLPFTTSDGYIWKYMYTVSLARANKFLTPSFIPVRNVTTQTGVEADRQRAVQNSAANGSIEVIEVNQGGSGYYYVSNGAVTAAGTRTLTLTSSPSANISAIDGIYTRSSVYISSGTGVGQLRRIVNYNGATRVLTVNSAFTTTCNTDSRVTISPTITVVGDGGNANAYSTVDTTLGSIDNIVVVGRGSGYTTGVVYITANTVHGSGAQANAIISPTGGHGADMIRQLSADKVMLNVQMDNNMGSSATGRGYVPSNTEFRTVSIMKDPMLKVNANNTFVVSESVANTSNSPTTLRLGYKLKFAYDQIIGGLPVNPLNVNDIITTKRFQTLAASGSLGFVTDTGTDLATNALRNAVRAANGTVYYVRDDEAESDTSIYSVYINNVETYAQYVPYRLDDIVLKSDSSTEVGTILQVQGPEANVFSGEILYTENVQAVTRDPGQIEDIKIILDF